MSPHRLFCIAAAFFAATSTARSETVSAVSAAGAVDTCPPRIEMLAPETGAIFYAGQTAHFQWRVQEINPPVAEQPLGFTIRVEGETLVQDSLLLAAGEIQSRPWLVPELETMDCRWELALVDAFGNGSQLTSTAHPIVIDGSPAEELPPACLALEQNFPNPFNPRTRFRFSLPRAGTLRLSIFDVGGREVARLWDGHREAGWWEADWQPRGLPSGVYLARLCQGDRVLTRKALLLK